MASLVCNTTLLLHITVMCDVVQLLALCAESFSMFHVSKINRKKLIGKYHKNLDFWRSVWVEVY